IQKLKDTGNFDFVEKDNIGLIFLGMNLETQPLSEDLLCRYPFQISGGQCQKVALDISVQAQIHNLLKNLQKDLGLAYLLISHQPEVIRFMAHETIHLEEGKISKCSYS
ncbi:MAG: hypothetical protein JW999_11755, partial [Methanotrichaceae archaeon]|nr:hypothetical protein [Methanotrichaceae archaeon]